MHRVTARTLQPYSNRGIYASGRLLGETHVQNSEEHSGECHLPNTWSPLGDCPSNVECENIRRFGVFHAGIHEWRCIGFSAGLVRTILGYSLSNGYLQRNEACGER